MNYRILLNRDDTMIADHTISADAAISLLASLIAPQTETQPIRPRKPTKEAGNNKWQRLSDKKPSRRGLPDEKKKEIENLLLADVSVAEIEAAAKVSRPTIYLIKTRLKSEGRI